MTRGDIQIRRNKRGKLFHEEKVQVKDFRENGNVRVFTRRYLTKTKIFANLLFLQKMEKAILFNSTLCPELAKKCFATVQYDTVYRYVTARWYHIDETTKSF